MWRGGCIIRSVFLGKIKEAFDNDKGLKNLMLDPFFKEKVESSQQAWRNVIATSVTNGYQSLHFQQHWHISMATEVRTFLPICFRPSGITLEHICMKEWISQEVSSSIPTGQDGAVTRPLQPIRYKEDLNLGTKIFTCM